MGTDGYFILKISANTGTGGSLILFLPSTQNRKFFYSGFPNKHPKPRTDLFLVLISPINTWNRWFFDLKI
jgi:hypothetical protein